MLFWGDKANSSHILIVEHFTFQRKEAFQGQPAASRWAQQSRAAAGAGGAGGGSSCGQETQGAHSGCCLCRFLAIPLAALRLLGLWDVPPGSHGTKASAFWLFSISHLLPAAAIWLFPSPDTSSSHLCISPRLCSSSERGALAAAAISQLESSLCSGWDSVCGCSPQEQVLVSTPLAASCPMGNAQWVCCTS